ncbi:DUF1049 domain-containing protein [Pseudomonas sp. TE3610]
MRKAKQLLLVVLILAVVGVATLFMLENQQSVGLVVLGRTGPQLPVSVLIIVAFLAGMVVGPVLALLASMRRLRPPVKVI